MTLFIDIGNTNIKFAHQGKEDYISTNSKDRDVINKLVEHTSGVDLVILASVVKPMGDLVLNYLSRIEMPVYSFDNTKYGEYINTTEIDFSEMGADRMLVMAAVDSTQNNIIIDLGTALTIDVLRGTNYLTGYIYPGIDLAISSLFSGTDALPKIAFKNIEVLQANLDTESQISTSIVLGITGLLNGVVKLMEVRYPKENFNIFLTGNGFKKISEGLKDVELEQLLSFSYVLDYDLNLKGFEAIERNIRGEEVEEVDEQKEY